jgi:hypothetical protein
MPTYCGKCGILMENTNERYCPDCRNAQRPRRRQLEAADVGRSTPSGVPVLAGRRTPARRTLDETGADRLAGSSALGRRSRPCTAKAT